MLQVRCPKAATTWLLFCLIWISKMSYERIANSCVRFCERFEEVKVGVGDGLAERI